MHPTRPAASIDWPATGLGEPARWPHALRLTVDIMLGCPAPMLLAWGAQRHTFANPAYAALAGNCSPPLPASPEFAAAFGLAAHGQNVALHAQPLAFPSQPDQHFDLHLTPLRDEQGQVGGVLCALAPSARQLAVPSAGLRILVVEDNLDAQYLVCEMLKAFGHDAEGVSHAEGALGMISAGAYDILFSDVSLPGMSGVELARKALHMQPGLQVVFASGYGDALLRHVEFPYASLQKPFEIEQLQAVLARFVARPQV